MLEYFGIVVERVHLRVRVSRAVHGNDSYTLFFFFSKISRRVTKKSQKPVASEEQSAQLRLAFTETNGT